MYTPDTDPKTRLPLILFWLAILPLQEAYAFPAKLFGYSQHPQTDEQPFGQWIQVLERHIQNGTVDGECDETRFNRCHLLDWQSFLRGIKNQPRDQQLSAVNQYANQKQYVLDIDNYGVEDYWAIPREFLYNNGDCEDYAITKLFSLRWLGFPMDELRIVVLQDTNLRIPHAVLAVANSNDIMIMDNQINEVISHRDIVHYAPVYSINESHWWIHLPN